MLRGARIRTKQLQEMMDVVADLRRNDEEENKYIPDWSSRVQEEVTQLEAMAKGASEAEGSVRDYPVELSRLRNELLERKQQTLDTHPPTKSALEKAALLVKGGVEAVAGVFVEAAKQVVDLLQIAAHFVSFGKYQPKLGSVDVRGGCG
jgi:hypothetical protein